MYEQFRDRVRFFCIYIEEAHPSDGWQLPANVEESVIFDQPASMEERAAVAEACMLRLHLAMPTLLDDMQNSTDLAYSALPERLYVLDSAGDIVYKSGPGPYGFDVDAWERAIERVLV